MLSCRAPVIGARVFPQGDRHIVPAGPQSSCPAEGWPGGKRPAAQGHHPEEETLKPEIAKKLARLACINNNLEKLNETEPLPPEFDEILVAHVNLIHQT
jgi:hypothetical protein